MLQDDFQPWILLKLITPCSVRSLLTSPSARIDRTWRVHKAHGVGFPSTEEDRGRGSLRHHDSKSDDDPSCEKSSGTRSVEGHKLSTPGRTLGSKASKMSYLNLKAMPEAKATGCSVQMPGRLPCKDCSRCSRIAPETEVGALKADGRAAVALLQCLASSADCKVPSVASKGRSSHWCDFACASLASTGRQVHVSENRTMGPRIYQKPSPSSYADTPFCSVLSALLRGSPATSLGPTPERRRAHEARSSTLEVP